MVSFYIVRHGQTLLNSIDRAQGWTDSPLTDAGKQTAVELGHKLKDIDFNTVYASDTLRAVQTAELVLRNNKNPNVPIKKDARLREWCLGSMEAENNTVFINNVIDWMGGASFAELNERLPDVADVIYGHDTTGMAEPFQTIEERLKSAFTDMTRRHRVGENSNILVVTHAFAIKTLFHLFAPEQLSKVGKVKNAAVSRLISDGRVFSLEPDLQL